MTALVEVVFDDDHHYTPMLYTREVFQPEEQYEVSCGDCGRRMGWWRKPLLTTNRDADRNLGAYWARMDPCPCAGARR